MTAIGSWFHDRREAMGLFVLLALMLGYIIALVVLNPSGADMSESRYAPYTPYAPYTAGPVVHLETEPYAPYTAGPVVREEFRPYAPYTAGPVVGEARKAPDPYEHYPYR